MLKSDKKLFLSTIELAKILNVSRIEIFRRIKYGTIPATKVGRVYVIDRNSLPEVLGQKNSKQTENNLASAVKKTILEYGETLKLLAEE